jgi:beta-glucosidase
MPNKENEVGLSIIQYPGIFREEAYLERSKIDYRWYTANNVVPAYPFGHGLSYTTFEYSGLSIDNNKVTVNGNNNCYYL